MRNAAATLFLILLMGLSIPFPAFPQMYIWTDKDGVKHFTDNPPPDAEDLRVMDEQKTDETKIDELQNTLKKLHDIATRCAELHGEKVKIINQKKVLATERSDALIEKINQMPNPSRSIREKLSAIEKTQKALEAKERLIDAQISQNRCD